MTPTTVAAQTQATTSTLTVAQQLSVRSVAAADPEVRALLSGVHAMARTEVVPWGPDDGVFGGLVIYDLDSPITLPAGTRRVRLDPASAGYLVTSSQNAVTNVSRLLVLVAFDRSTVVSIESGPGGHVEGQRPPRSP